MAAVRSEDFMDLIVELCVCAIEPEVVPKDRDIYETAPWLQHTSDLAERGVNIGNVFQSLCRRSCVTAIIWQTRFVSALFQQCDIWEVTAV